MPKGAQPARWRGEIQLILILSLLDSIPAAVATYRLDRFRQIVGLMALAWPTLAGAIVDLILKQAALLGRGGTHRGLSLASARAVPASSFPASYLRMRSSVSMLDSGSPVTS